MTMTSTTQMKHGLVTRALHAGLAVAVIVQLLTSLAAEAPSPRHAGNWIFGMHEYAGLTAFVFVLGFWLTVAVRRSGTEWGLMLPWISRARRSALWSDAKAQLLSLLRLRMPVYTPHSPLASAVHGLGLLLMLAMASTGAAYYFINTGDPRAGGLVGVIMFIHTSLANLVWAYLIGHAGVAVIHHYTQHTSLTEMWSFGLGRDAGGLGR